MQNYAWLNMHSAKTIGTQAPIHYEEALRVVLAGLEKSIYADGIPEGGTEIVVDEIRLEYLLEPVKANQNSDITVIPVWSFYLTIRQREEFDSFAYGQIDLKEFEYIAAVDARNGNVIVK